MRQALDVVTAYMQIEADKGGGGVRYMDKCSFGSVIANTNAPPWFSGQGELFVGVGLEAQPDGMSALLDKEGP